MCLNQRDDILICSRTIEEHNETLEALFQKAKDFGITFNLHKCQFGVEELNFTDISSQKKDWSQL